MTTISSVDSVYTQAAAAIPSSADAADSKGNTIIGGSGNDTIIAFGYNNTIDSGEGDDSLVIVGDLNIVDSGDGNDKILVNGDNNTISAGAGSDSIYFSGDDNLIDGGDGDDYIQSIDPTEVDICGDGRGAWGDPHFEIVGKDGNSISFDHKGIDGHTYYLFGGDGLTIDGKYVDNSDSANPQVIGEVYITAGTDKVVITNDGTVTVNGEELNVGTHTLADGSTIQVSVSSYTIIPSDGTGQVDITLTDGYFNIDPSGAFEGLDGILGTAIEESRALTTEECNQFDLANGRYSYQEDYESELENVFGFSLDFL